MTLATQAQPFCPGDATAKLTYGASTSRVAVPNDTDPRQPRQVRIVNKGANDVFIRFGGVGVNAALTDMIVLSGATEVLTLPVIFSASGVALARYVAAISSGAGDLYVTIGDGV